MCGIKTAMSKVLEGDQAGAHIILVTRGKIYWLRFRIIAFEMGTYIQRTALVDAVW